MGRHKSVAQIERELAYAKKKAEYEKDKPSREEGGSPRKQPKIAYAYKPMAIAASDTAKKYLVQASKNSVDFFTQTALNLTDSTGFHKRSFKCGQPSVGSLRRVARSSEIVDP